jgi:hypothetical protein
MQKNPRHAGMQTYAPTKICSVFHICSHLSLLERKRGGSNSAVSLLACR